MKSLPTYDEYVASREAWALASCAADPAMQRAFEEAGGSTGWVNGLSLRKYCEREGLMRTSRSSSGVAKGQLAMAWDLADIEGDGRGLNFDEFCVFMHLICIVTAGGSLPEVLPTELVPPLSRKKANPPPLSSLAAEDKEDNTKTIASKTKAPERKEQADGESNDDEVIARALQQAYDDEYKSSEAKPEEIPVLPAKEAMTSPPAPNEVVSLGGSTENCVELSALRKLAMEQGGLLEMENVLFALDEAVENERWIPGAGFSSAHLLPTDVSAWSSDDGSVTSPERSFVAPNRVSSIWQLVSDWRALVDESTDPYGWSYSRGLPSPLAPGVPFASAAAPFAGAVARRRKWTRLSCRSLAVRSKQSLAEEVSAKVAMGQHRSAAERIERGEKSAAAAAQLLSRLQDSFRTGVSEINRRLSASGTRTEAEGIAQKSHTTENQHTLRLISRAKEKYDSPVSARAKAMLSGFVHEFGPVSLVSDEQRANTVKRFLQAAASVLSRERTLIKLIENSEDDFFLELVDELEADLYRRLAKANFSLVLEEGPADAAFEKRLEALQPVRPDMLDAVDVESFEPHWPRAVDALRSIPQALTPRRKVKKIRSAVDDIFQCLARYTRETREKKRRQRESSDSEESDDDSVPPGADDLLPLVILATLRARTPDLFAELRFVELYSPEDRLHGEDGFLLTQVVAAASFLRHVDATQLKGIENTSALEALLGKPLPVVPDSSGAHNTAMFSADDEEEEDEEEEQLHVGAKTDTAVQDRAEQDSPEVPPPSTEDTASSERSSIDPVTPTVEILPPPTALSDLPEDSPSSNGFSRIDSSEVLSPNSPKYTSL